MAAAICRVDLSSRQLPEISLAETYWLRDVSRDIQHCWYWRRRVYRGRRRLANYNLGRKICLPNKNEQAKRKRDSHAWPG